MENPLQEKKQIRVLMNQRGKMFLTAISNSWNPWKKPPSKLRFSLPSIIIMITSNKTD